MKFVLVVELLIALAKELFESSFPLRSTMDKLCRPLKALRSMTEILFFFKFNSFKLLRLEKSDPPISVTRFSLKSSRSRCTPLNTDESKFVSLLSLRDIFFRVPSPRKASG